MLLTAFSSGTFAFSFSPSSDMSGSLSFMHSLLCVSFVYMTSYITSNCLVFFALRTVASIMSTLRAASLHAIVLLNIVILASNLRAVPLFAVVLGAVSWHTCSFYTGFRSFALHSFAQRSFTFQLLHFIP